MSTGTDQQRPDLHEEAGSRPSTLELRRRSFWNDDSSEQKPVSRSELAFTSVWLVFLISPAVAIVAGPASIPVKVLSGLSLIAFGVLYTVSWVKPRLVSGLGSFGSAMAWIAVLCVCIVGAAPAAGPTVLATAPFLMALLVFRLPLRAALVSTVAVAVAVIGFVAWRLPESAVWVTTMMSMCAVIFVMIRWTADHEDRSVRMAHDLELSRQREEFARDVHDILGHSLTVVAVKTELARKLLDRDPERARAELDDVLALTREALGEVRSTVGRLRTPTWAEQLHSARTALDAADIEARLPADAGTVPVAQQELFAWCLREAVTNVVRHSGATRCTVAAEPGLLAVTDDGVGMGSDALADGATEGNGIAGLRERVGRAGGTLSLGPAHGSDLTPDAHRAKRPGTRVEVRL